MPSREILVTGGAGFIGSHVCKRLASQGHVPVTIDNLSTGHRDSVRWGPFHLSDIRDKNAVKAALTEHGIETVMHFAASAYVGESMTNPAQYYDNNVGGMISLLDACREAGVKFFVLSSSCATYGMPKKLPISEASPQQPINPYGRTKLICEQMLADHNSAYGMPHAILRYFNACGADPDGTLAERHTPETHLIPLILLTAADQRPHLDIFGTDYDTPDGTCIRDYIHVHDLARGHLAALEHLWAGKGNLTVNLGSGRGHSIREIVAAVEKMTGRPLSVRLRPRRPGDPPALFANVRRAQETLGFNTEVSDIETIIQHAAPTFGLEMTHDAFA